MELLHLSARLSSPDLLEASEGRSEERKQSVLSALGPGAKASAVNHQPRKGGAGLRPS